MMTREQLIEAERRVKFRYPLDEKSSGTSLT